MLARSMTDLLPQDALEDVLVYPNEDDENEPRVRSSLQAVQSALFAFRRKLFGAERKAQRMLLIGFGAVAFLLVIVAIPSGDILTLLFGMFLLMFGYMFIRSRLGSGDEGRIPKVLVNTIWTRGHRLSTTATLSGSLLGDVRHDPFQSGGMETPAHDRVEPGAIHRANKGVLYIDEINLLRLEEQQALLTAMQERAFPISGRSDDLLGALTKTEPVPCDFILIAAGNLDAIKACTQHCEAVFVGMDTRSM